MQRAGRKGGIAAFIVTAAVIGMPWWWSPNSHEVPAPQGGVAATAGSSTGQQDGSGAMTRQPSATAPVASAGTAAHPTAGADPRPAVAVAVASDPAPANTGPATTPLAQPAEPPAEAEAWQAVAAFLASPARAELAQLETYHARIAEYLQTVRPREALLGLEADQRERVGARLQQLEAARWRAVEARAAALGLAMHEEDEHGPRWLVGFDGDEPLYEFPTNVEAAMTTGVTYVRQQPDWLDVDGSGFSSLVYDGGVVREHEEFETPDGGSRIAKMHLGGTSGHADHVAGTIAAEGKNPKIQGMAPAARIRSRHGSSLTMTSYYGQTRPGAHGYCVVSNTSLGGGGASGGYSSSDSALDSTVYSLGYFLPFASAGNAGKWYTITGWDKEAKNSMCVASAAQVNRDSDGSIIDGGRLSGFSSKGPPDDGRIKPDITANGQSVLSTSGDGSGTSKKQGTSMSSPNAAGSAIVIQDYCSRRLPGHLLRSHTLKGLICHSADDFGNTGPDYSFGWGILNALEACHLIRHYAEHPTSNSLVEDFLDPDEVMTYDFTWNGTDPIMATLCWIEPPGFTHPDSADDRTPDLINDLDIRIIDPEGNEYLPWLMPYVRDGFVDGDHKKAAERGDNNTDNVEQVLIDDPSLSGTYTVRISHKGSLKDDASQHFALCLDGAADGPAWPAPTIDSIDRTSGSGDQTRVLIEGSGFRFGAQAVLRDGGNEIPAVAIAEVEDRLIAWWDLAQAPAGTYDVVIRNLDGQEVVETDAFVVQAREILLLEDFDSASLPSDWSHEASQGDDRWQISDQRPVAGTHSAFVSNTADNTLSQLTSPTVAVPAGALDLQLAFSHRYEFTGDDDDACVLEVRRDGGTWYDVLDERSGGIFVEERYDYPYTYNILPENDWQGDADGDGDSDNGRNAWVLHSMGIKRTNLRLDAGDWADHDIQFRWRFTSDNANGGGGWWVDEIRLAAAIDGAGNIPPQITAGPTADPDPVTGTTSTLSVGANDGGDGPAALTYQWSVIDKPAGAADPDIATASGTDADQTAVTFFKAGSYRFRVSISDGGLQVSDEVTVTVDQSPQNMGLLP